MVTRGLLPAPIDAPPAAMPQSGLIPLLDKIGRVHRDSTPQRWMISGSAYRPESAGPGAHARSITSGAADHIGADVNVSDFQDIKTYTADGIDIDGVVAGYTFLVETAESLSAFGWRAEDYQGRVQRRLASLESKIVEHEFWTGEVAQLDDLDPAMYQWLAQTTAVDLTPAGGAVAPKLAMSILEEAMGDANNGTGVVHLPRLSAILAPDRWVEGPMIVWPDSGAAVGAGYPGTGPDGSEPAAGEQWWYATDLCDVRLGPVQIWPPTFEEALNKHLNTVEFRAQRVAQATWDGFTHVAIRVTTTA